MTPAEANALLAYARGLDNFIPNTDANADTWAAALQHVPLEAGKVIVSDYYGKHPNPDQRRTLDASQVRRMYRLRSTQYEAKSRAISPPPPRRGRRMPRQTLEWLQARGRFLDRDPDDYEYR